MPLTRTFSKRLGILAHETELLKWSALHAFSSGCFNSLLMNIPLALFLSEFRGGSLPYIYIANAGISILMGVVYSFGLSRIRFSRLQLSILSAIAAVTLLFWIGISFSKGPWIIVSTLILAWVVGDFAKLELWSVLNRLFTLQQSKRLFGLIGGANSVAGILTGLASPFLIQLLGTNQMLLLAFAISALPIFSLIQLRKLAPRKLDLESASEHDEQIANAQLSFRSAIKKPYYIYIAMGAFFAVFANYGLDVLFNTVAQQRYTSAAALASFFAVFYAITDATRFGVALLLPTLLKRLGIVMTLALQPFITLLLGVAALSADLVPPIAVLAFWLISSMQLFFTSYGNGIRDAAFLILYQPLMPSNRSWLQSRVETVVTPIATAFVGIGMVLADQTIGVSNHTFMPFIIGCNLLLFVFTLLLRSGYVKVLQDALFKPYLTQPTFSLVDKNILPILQSKLKSRFPEEVVFALRSLETSDFAGYKDALKVALNSEFADVRRYAVLQVGRYADQTLFEKVHEVAMNDKSNDVRAAAFQVLAASSRDTDNAAALFACQDKDYVVRGGAILGVLTHLPRNRTEAKKALHDLAASPQPDARRAAANVIGESLNFELRDLLLLLLDDRVLRVREAAMLAAGRIGDVDHLRQAFQGQDISMIPHSIIQAIALGKESVSTQLITSFGGFQRPAQRLIIKASGYLSNDSSRDFLLEQIDQSDLSLREPVIMSLTQRRYEAEKSAYPKLGELINSEIENINFFRDKRAAITENDATKTLRDLLNRSVELAQERLLRILSFIYGYDDILKIRAGLASRNEEHVSYALELTDRIVAPKYKDKIMAALERASSDTPATEKSFQALLAEILENKSGIYNTWIVAAAIYFVGDQKQSALFDTVRPYLKHNEFILAETAGWVFTRR